MDEEKPKPDDQFDYFADSWGELALKWLWILLLGTMWIGVIIGIFTGAPALELLGGFLMAAVLTGGFYFVFIRENFIF